MRHTMHAAALAITALGVVGMIGCATTGGTDSAPTTTRSDLPSSIQVADPVKGDTFVYNANFGGTRSTLQEEVISTDGGVYQIKATFNGKERLNAMEKGTSRAQKAWSIANYQQIAFSAPHKWIETPALSVGATWQDPGEVKGETFQVKIAPKYTVAGAERIKVPGGEFDTLRVDAVDSFSGTSSDGKPISGTAKFSYWYAESCRCIVKHKYSNSYKETSERELVSFHLAK